MAKINQYTPSVLGWVADPSLQAHRYGCCNDDHEWDDIVMPIPKGEIPSLQLALRPYTLPSDIKIDVFDGLANPTIDAPIKTYFATQFPDAASQPVHFYIKELAVPGIFSGTVPAYALITYQTQPDDLLCGKYFLRVLINEGQSNECAYYSNLYKIVPRTCCLHKFIFWNDCDRDGIIYKYNLPNEYDTSTFRHRLYIDGCNLLQPEEKVKEKRTLLLNGCYRTDQYELFEMYRLEVPRAFHNLRKAVRWMGGFDNIKLITSNGLQSNIQNVKIENLKSIGKRKCFDKFEIVFEDNYLNPTACCFDYSTEVYTHNNTINKFSNCGEGCYLNDIGVTECGMESITISYFSSSSEIEYQVCTRNENTGVDTIIIATTTTDNNPFTITGLTHATTYIIKLNNDCGANTEFEFTTKDCTLELETTIVNKDCDVDGAIIYSITGNQGFVSASITDDPPNLISIDVLTASGAINLEPGDYIFFVTDDICATGNTGIIETFTIDDECECDYDIDIEAIDCTCNSSGKLKITVNELVSSGTFQIIVKLSGVTIATIPSSSLDVNGCILLDQQDGGGLLDPGTYSVHIEDTGCISLGKNTATINNLCICNTPTLNNITDQDSTANSVVLSWDHIDKAFAYCIEYGKITDDISNYQQQIVFVGSDINPSNPVASFELEGLGCGTQYYIRVQTKCNSTVKPAISAWSNWESFYTDDCSDDCDDDAILFSMVSNLSGELCLMASPINSNGIIAWSLDNVNYTNGNMYCDIGCELIHSSTNTDISIFNNPSFNLQNLAVTFDNLQLPDPTQQGTITNCPGVIVLDYTASNGDKKYFAFYPQMANGFQFTSSQMTKDTIVSTSGLTCLVPYSESDTDYSDTGGSLDIYCCNCPTKIYWKLTNKNCPDIVKCVEIYPDGTLDISDLDPCDTVDVSIDGIEVNGETCVEVTLTNEPPGTEVQTSLDNFTWTYQNPICIDEGSYCNPIYQSACPSSPQITYHFADVSGASSNHYIILFSGLDNLPDDIVALIEGCEEILQVSFIDNNGDPIRLSFASNEINDVLYFSATDSILFTYEKTIGTYSCQEMLQDTLDYLDTITSSGSTSTLPGDCLEISCCTCPQEVFVRVVFEIDCPTICKKVIVQDSNNIEVIDIVCNGSTTGTSSTGGQPTNSL